MIYLTDYRYTKNAQVDLMEDIVHPQKVHWFPDSYKRAKTGIVYPPHKVAEMVLDPELVKEIRENPVGKTAFILASGNAHFSGINPRTTKPTSLSYEYKFLPFTLTQVYAGRTAQAFGANDHIVTDSTACASSLKVLMDVQNLIDNFGFERVVVLAIEDQVNNSVLEFFGEAQASLTWKEESQGVISSAFDSVNHGFHVAQGACLAIFESGKTAMRGSKRPKATLKGAYTASEDCANAIGQREDGQGFKRAMEGALLISKIRPSNITIVKTHGTGTKSNNIAEKAALEDVLSEYVATSYKPTIGHTMGVSGLLETCMLLDDLDKGFVPKIANRTEMDTKFLSIDVDAPSGDIMTLAAGMGSVYSAAVLSREI
jgi:3-oxoacyl-(acyl-carrier-protein) synthase